MKHGAGIGAHDRSRRTRATALLGALALLATFGCARAPLPRAAPFGAALAAPLPHADVLGFVRFVPSEASEQRAALSQVFAALDNVSVCAPPLALINLAFDHPFVATGTPLAVLLLDPEVHGGLAAYAWQGDQATLRAAAEAGGIQFDEEGRLLLPGRSRAGDLDFLSDTLRHRVSVGVNDLPEAARIPDDDDEPRAAKSGRRKEALPRVPHVVVEEGGVVVLLPALDGKRNVLDTLAATQLLDPATGTSACIRFAFARMAARFRDPVQGMTSFAIMQGTQSLASASPAWSQSIWPLQWQIQRAAEGTLDALFGADEVFALEDAAGWHAYVRAKPGSFLESLLAVAVNRPMADLLRDLPDVAAFVAGSFDPLVLPQVPELWQRSRRLLFRRVSGPPQSRRMERDVVAADDESRDFGAEFLASCDGRFWFAAEAGGGAATKSRAGKGFAADAAAGLGGAALLTYFGMKPGVDPQPFIPMLKETVLPQQLRADVMLAATLLYRPAPRADGVLEVISNECDRVRRETLAAMAAGTGARAAPDAPAQAFLAARLLPERAATDDDDAAAGGAALRGDVYGVRQDDGIELLVRTAGH